MAITDSANDLKPQSTNGIHQTGDLVCVTGASGHLGSWLVKRLLELGYRVRATVRDASE